MDKGTGIGLAIALICIFGASVVESGSIAILFALLNIPSLMIVFGGTIGALLVAFPMERVTRLAKVLAVAFRMETTSVREIMESDVAAMSERHEGKFAMFAAAGGFAPTMGIIGTVMGLVNVLSHLDKPDELGKSIAGAFIATLYGVMSANIFWLPIGERLKQRNKEEVALKTLAVEGVLAVQAGDNPRVVREKLEAFLPMNLRGEDTAADEAAGGAVAPEAAAA